MEQKIRITQFLDGEGKITQLPGRQKVKQAVLEYLAAKFELGRGYTERQINEVCGQWHTFGDYFLLRRELVDNGLMDRERDGSRYWRVWEEAPASAPTEAPEITRD